MKLQRVPWVSVLLLAGGCLGAISSPAGPVEAKCGADYSPGHVSIHRLTNDEYSNTVRDLLFTTARPGDQLPPTTAGFSGFTNDSDHLNVYDDLISGYYQAAESLAHDFLASKGQPGGAYQRVVTCAPSNDCARATLTALARRAYRRPLEDGEADALMAIFAGESDFDTGLEDVLVSLLISPKFIFNYAPDAAAQTDGAVFRINDHALASRLSYFLWQSMPDDALFQLADAGTLSQPEVLQAEVQRMLADGKAAAFEAVLRNEWAGLASLATPSASRPGLDDGLRMSMVGEVDAFLNDLIGNDRSFLTVLTGNYSYVDQKLAAYYGVPYSNGDPSAFVREDQSPNHRRGIITTAAVMTATAGDVLYTHPVKRGKWVTNHILCSEPPPPPPNIPVIDFNPNSGGGTPREKLAAHTASPACSGCHTVMDAVGLGLENFGTFGEWRNVYPGSAAAIDASGTLPDSAAFTEPFQMVSEIADDAATRACLARQVMSYAVTRAMTSSDDKCVSGAIGAASVTPTGSFSELVLQIVSSKQFQMQTGEAP